MSKVETIIRKNHPTKVIAMKVSDLDPVKCSSKFLQLQMAPEAVVYVKCDVNGQPLFKGRLPKYSIFPNLNQ